MLHKYSAYPQNEISPFDKNFSSIYAITMKEISLDRKNISLDFGVLQLYILLRNLRTEVLMFKMNSTFVDMSELCKERRIASKHCSSIARVK